MDEKDDEEFTELSNLAPPTHLAHTELGHAQMVELHTPYLKPPSWPASCLFGGGVGLQEGETQAEEVHPGGCPRELVLQDSLTSLAPGVGWEHSARGSKCGSSPGVTFTSFSISFPLHRLPTVPAASSLK